MPLHELLIAQNNEVEIHFHQYKICILEHKVKGRHDRSRGTSSITFTAKLHRTCGMSIISPFILQFKSSRNLAREFLTNIFIRLQTSHRSRNILNCIEYNLGNCSKYVSMFYFTVNQNCLFVFHFKNSFRSY